MTISHVIFDIAEADGVTARLPAEAANPGFSEYEAADLRAVVETRDRAFERAMRVLDQARETAPRNTDHYANLGRAYQVWGERTLDGARRGERLAESLRWFDEAIAQSPNNAGLRTERATTLYLDNQVEAAMQGIDDAIKLDAQFGRPLRLRPTIYREQEDWAKAEKHFREAIATEAVLPSSHLGLGATLVGEKRFDEALAVLAEAEGRFVRYEQELQQAELQTKQIVDAERQAYVDLKSAQLGKPPPQGSNQRDRPERQTRWQRSARAGVVGRWRIRRPDCRDTNRGSRHGRLGTHQR